jgi:hypothetical protein
MKASIWVGGGLLVLASLLLYGFGTFDPNPIRWAAIAALCVFGVMAWAFHGAPIPRDRITWAALAFAGYCSLSLLWSPDWRQGIVELHTVWALTGVFLISLWANRARLELFVPLVAVIAIGLEIWISENRPGIHGGLGNENFQAEFLVVMAPLCLVWFLKVPNSLFGVIGAIAGIAAIGQALFYNGSNAELAGLAVLGAVLAGWLLARQRMWLAGGFGLVAGLSIWAAYGTQMWQSLLYRYEFAYNTIFMWLDHPWIGVGLGGYNYTYPEYGELHLAWADHTAVHQITHYVGATHNEAIQGLATFGVVGCILASLVIVLAIRSGGYPQTPLSQAGLAVIISAFGLLLVGFPLQNASSAIPIVGALGMLSVPTHRPIYLRGLNWACTPLILALIGTLVWFHGHAIQGQQHFSLAQAWAKRGEPVQSLIAANEAAKAFPLRGRYRMQVSLSLESVRANIANAKVDKTASDKAHQLALSAAPRHAGVLFARGAYLMNSGRWRETREIEVIVHDLESYARAHPESWAVSASYWGFSGNQKRAAHALMNGVKAAHRLGEGMAQIRQVAKSLNMEIREQ